MMNRTTKSTLLNEKSSRSHFFMIIKIKRQIIEKERCYTGKITLVDLAGSEDNRRTGNQGNAIKESGMINKSLLAFNTLIDQLSNGIGFPNYRQSCLTRLLKDSLGGNSYSCLIANVAQGDYHDTLNTLNFAKKGMKIGLFLLSSLCRYLNYFFHPTVSNQNYLVNTPFQSLVVSQKSSKTSTPTRKPKKRNSLIFSKSRQILGDRSNKIPSITSSKISKSLSEVCKGKLSDSHRALIKRTFLKEAENATKIEKKIENYQRALVYCKGSEEVSEVARKMIKEKTCKDRNENSWSSPLCPFSIYKNEPTSFANLIKVQVDGIRQQLEEKLLLYVNSSSSTNELQKLKGVGKVNSKKILQLKQESGAFQSFDDMKERVGFSDKTLSNFICGNLDKFIEISLSP